MSGGFVHQEHAELMAMRSKPRLLILDEDLRIVFADWAAMFTVFRVCEDPSEPLEKQRLPEPLRDAVRTAVAGWDTNGPAESIIEPLPELVLRVSRLSGVTQSFIALFCESRARRDDVAHAARAFGLRRREQEVLGLVLRGFRSSEIAEEMMIAEATVHDYFKQLLRKTKSRNRTEMLTRVLGWGEKHG
jgi:DNA-binding NarL/FixJ family response regulator